MSYRDNYRSGAIYGSSVDQRIAFLRKTYSHLAGAIGLFVVLSCVLFQAGLGLSILQMTGASQMGWLLILGGFILVGYLAQAMARADRPIGTQYLGLGLYVVAESIIFSPLLYIAGIYYPHVLVSATIVTLAVFIGLTAYVLIYNKDFSFLGGTICVVSLVALGVIVCGALFGFNLGTWFSGAMILLAGMCILFSTSKVLKYYRADQYVGAALELFAAIALLFWYVLRIFLELQRR